VHKPTGDDRRHVLMLTWEYPPRSIGGLAQHVYELSQALVGRGVRVTVVTASEDDGSRVDGDTQRLSVHRVAVAGPKAAGFIPWVLQLNLAMLERAAMLMESEAIDVVHVHDWSAAFAGRAVKHAARLPLVATIHATEAGRHNGIHNEDQAFISDVEWWLTYEAWRVICCSGYMQGHVRHLFGLPGDKTRVVPNGISPPRADKGDVARVRRQYGLLNSRVVFFVGRLVPEKGVQVLLHALPAIVAAHPDVRLLIAGTGHFEAELRRLADQLGVAGRVVFCGYVDDVTRDALYRVSEAAVFPSLYEPFGIVALEAMISGTPVVVAAAGGLSEIVTPERTGLTVPVGNAAALAGAVNRLLTMPDLAGRLAREAQVEATGRYGWDGVARQTEDVYDEVLREYGDSPWGRMRSARPPSRVPAVAGSAAGRVLPGGPEGVAGS